MGKWFLRFGKMAMHGVRFTTAIYTQTNAIGSVNTGNLHYAHVVDAGQLTCYLLKLKLKVKLKLKLKLKPKLKLILKPKLKAKS